MSMAISDIFWRRKKFYSLGPLSELLLYSEGRKSIFFSIFEVNNNNTIRGDFPKFAHIFGFYSYCVPVSSQGEHTSNKISLVRGCNLRTELSQAQLDSTQLTQVLPSASNFHSQNSAAPRHKRQWRPQTAEFLD